jgi:DNA-binding transcriptional regulator YdaS (Cro superfamily)
MTQFRTFIHRAIEIKGSQQKLAEAMGCSQQQISYLLNGADRVSAEMAIKIERATNRGVSRHDLRPDLYPIEQERAAS